MDTNPDVAAKDIDLKSVIAILRRQMKVIGYTTAAILGLAILFLTAVTETFTATALILVDPDGKSILAPQKTSPTSSGQDNAYVDSQVEILRSNAVALDVIAGQGLIADAEFGARVPLTEKLARAVGVANAAQINRDQAMAKTLVRFQSATAIRRRGLTYLISVSTTSQSPEQAAVLANTLAQSFIRQQVEAKVADTLSARDVLRQQMDNSTRALASYETALDKLVSSNMAEFTSSPTNAQAVELHAELSIAETKRNDTRLTETQARALMQQENWTGLATALEDDLLGQLGQSRVTLLQKMALGQGTQPAAELHQELARLDAQLSARTTGQLATIGAQIRSLDHDISGLRRQLRKEFLAGDLPPETLALVYSVQQESAIARTQYQNLLARMQDLDTASRIQVADSRIVSAALTPVAASFPNRTLVLIAAMAASLGIGVSLAFLKEYYIGGVTSTIQLSKLLQANCAAAIPLNPDRGAGRLSIADDIIDAPLSVYSESIRKLKAAFDQAFRVQQARDGTNGPVAGKTILVTSALENEGKTTMALALARTFAQAGRKTLLIDADLRRPSLHRHLGFEPQAGFLEYLSGSLAAEQSGSFYARDPASTLALIMGAERSEFPTDQLLCSARFETLLAQARDVYDVIVIDSSPLLPVVDARYIAHQADCVAMVVKWASTSQSDLRAAIQPLRDAMQPSAVLIPTLSQMHDKSERRSSAGYYSRYSAAI